MGFGFLPNEGQPDFDALLKKFSEMGIDSGALESAKSFLKLCNQQIQPLIKI
jgi:hypothetical protein